MDISDGLAAYLNEFGANQPLTFPVRALETASQVSCQIIPFPRLARPSANHLTQADPARSRSDSGPTRIRMMELTLKPLV
jgi:hypothetical protein